jgi:murein endopeptidase
MVLPAVIVPSALVRGGGVAGAGFVLEDPPSLMLRLDPRTGEPTPVLPGVDLQPPKSSVAREAAPEIDWHNATSVGLWWSGSLVDGTQLPVEGPDWVTWNPVTDSVPNAPRRLYGNERTIRTLVSVLAQYRAAHPLAPRVLVGDISFEGGGPMEAHVSHQNGLDVDVYYPRRDGALRAPQSADAIDRRLSQDLLDRFLAAGAHMVFVGYSTRLHGPQRVVIPWPNHENHMHVRFPKAG